MKKAGFDIIEGDSAIVPVMLYDAKFFTTLTLMAMVGTYALGVALIPKVISQTTALKISAVIGIILSFCIVSTTGFTSVLFVAALGISNALVWPAIWPLTLKGLGKFTKTASALLIMAISGGAIIPPLYGKLVDINKASYLAEGMNEALATATAATKGYWILLPCYIIILYYAIAGHKLGLKKK
jgi:fucose permease